MSRVCADASAALPAVYPRKVTSSVPDRTPRSQQQEKRMTPKILDRSDGARSASQSLGLPLNIGTHARAERQVDLAAVCARLGMRAIGPILDLLGKG